jgi:ankyrin repeat protein
MQMKSALKVCRAAAVMLVTLTWSGPAFCQEINRAAAAGELETVKALLKGNPALVSSRASNGMTPLHAAAGQGRKDVAELLLANKADVNAKEGHGATPLHLAAFEDHKDVAELLLANKADVNAKEEHGATPLIYTAAKGHRAVAELLLANKADVNATDNYGSTALHQAAHGGYRDVVELLLANKADVNAKNSNGQTPLQEATAAGKRDVAELLRLHGGHEETLAAPTPTSDGYRDLAPNDNLRCDAFADSITSSFGGPPPSGTGVHYTCVDKEGRTQTIKLKSTEMVDGKIETEDFGTFRLRSVGMSFSYMMTESQIKKLKTFLGF